MKKICFDSEFEIGDEVKVVPWTQTSVYQITGISLKLGRTSIADGFRRAIVLTYHISDRLNNAVGWFTGEELVNHPDEVNYHPDSPDDSESMP